MTSQRWREVGLNYLSALGVLGIGYGVYSLHPFLTSFYSGDQFKLFMYVFWGYVVVLPFFYLSLPKGHPTKCRLVWRALRHLPHRLPKPEEKVALLAVLIKLYFLPMMIAWVAHHSAATVNYTQQFVESGAFFPHGYWALFNLAFLVDVACFAVGYAVEHPRLGNEIRSVEPTVAGWLVALLCYPPFNDVTQVLLGWHSNDYPGFQTLWAQYLAGGAILVLMSIYAWASVTLAFKASNLTHRGIVVHGPYRWVRHPAYIAKNLAWWVGATPIIVAQWSQGPSAFAFAVFGTLGWSFIYFLRAITEERHLGRDPTYVAYCERVRYRFLPGLW